MSKTITVKMNIEIPRLPNFLMGDGNLKLDVGGLDDEDLVKLAERWQAALLEHARQRRTNEIFSPALIER